MALQLNELLLCCYHLDLLLSALLKHQHPLIKVGRYCVLYGLQRAGFVVGYDFVLVKRLNMPLDVLLKLAETEFGVLLSAFVSQIEHVLSSRPVTLNQGLHKRQVELDYFVS